MIQFRPLQKTQNLKRVCILFDFYLLIENLLAIVKKWDFVLVNLPLKLLKSNLSEIATSDVRLLI